MLTIVTLPGKFEGYFVPVAIPVSVVSEIRPAFFIARLGIWTPATGFAGTPAVNFLLDFWSHLWTLPIELKHPLLLF